MSIATLLAGSLPPRSHAIDSPQGSSPRQEEASSSHGYEFGLPDQLVGVFDNQFVDEPYDDDDDDEPVRVTMQPGMHRQAVLDGESVPDQLERLQAWEEQLQAYSDQLTETGWQSWKRGAVTSVMHELQRKVVPDTWQHAIKQADERTAALEERIARSADKERALLARIDDLENGPGCARELREALEKAELSLSQQRAREKQQSVFKQLLTSGALTDNTDGKSAAPAKRRFASAIGAVKSSIHDESLMGAFAKTGAAAPGITTGDGAAAGAVASGDAEMLQLQLAVAQREAAEARDEMIIMRQARPPRLLHPLRLSPQPLPSHKPDAHPLHASALALLRT